MQTIFSCTVGAPRVSISQCSLGRMGGLGPATGVHCRGRKSTRKPGSPIRLWLRGLTRQQRCVGLRCEAAGARGSTAAGVVGGWVIGEGRETAGGAGAVCNTLNAAVWWCEARLKAAGPWGLSRCVFLASVHGRGGLGAPPYAVCLVSTRSLTAHRQSQRLQTQHACSQSGFGFGEP